MLSTSLAILFLTLPSALAFDPTSHTGNHVASSRSAGLQPRAEYCTTQTVVEGDSCASLSERCGISSDDLLKYNKDDLCSTLVPGQKVCCSEGSLTPQKYDNGTCYTYTIQDGDNCYDIGLPWSLTIEDIENVNNGTTWGWTGCASLVVGLNMCLSEGYPPMPAPLENAVCGPQVPGTTFDGTITDASDLAALNPCPLNVCCNIWGQCGIDSSFCTESEGPSGNPGTSAPDVYGCISNCGTDIVNNDEGPPDGYKRVGYYETFNWDRQCLRMRAAWSNTLEYTHMHWAFGNIGEDFSVYVNDSYNQWDGFMSLDGVKKIVSFGGWGFSTDVGTYDILRQAMAEENRDKFVSNLVAFADETGIDGIDFDWEYPSAPDIPGIPAGLESDGPNYLATLKALREALDEKYSMSIAAPASYWYLKGFPIKDMAPVVDYIVFMAYDLHGQWDYGNKWAQSGCESGNCLRSHVNQTEVTLALAMSRFDLSYLLSNSTIVTKAGVPSNKIMVGESSYGRSFKMADAGCTGADCFFTGTNMTSDAAPGRCTNTGGYISNAEIAEIISQNPDSVNTWYDDDTASDYLVYDDVQWVAYMNYNTKQARRDTWKGLNFLGTIDWAVDLQDFNAADQVGPTGDYNESSSITVFDDMIWDWVNPGIVAPVDATNIIQASPLATVVTLTAHTTITLVSGGSLSTSFLSTTFSISEVGFQPFTINDADTSSGTVLTYSAVPRVTPDPLEIQVPNGWTITTGSNTLPEASSTSTLIGVPPPSSTSTSSSGNYTVLIGWLPSVSYNLPSRVTPKTVAPTDPPNNEQNPPPGPPPGVDDCEGDACTVGQDCTSDDCTRGGDCAGPNCTKGGECKGKNCVRGGQCTGDNCEEGGGCEGDGCKCGSGGCTGSQCNDETDCTGPWCDFKVTVTVEPPTVNPKPTCLVGCPTLAPCPGGGTSCNDPCNINQCPPGRMPTAKGCTSFTTASECTEIVSSTAVLTTPTTSWSTTTRTRCETIIDCDVTGMTITTTITTSEEPDKTADITGIYDDWVDSDHESDQAVFTSMDDDYSSWISDVEATPAPTTTEPPSPPPTSTPEPTADCAFW
ncbi:glycoside hydrolase family 18 protein [Hypoxylon sp. CI-4A]|nr:glycoside hydrolase family 18 protein [Hypoxylon sp. CI-4A]